MKQILVSQSVKAPENVQVRVKARKVTVTGPRGKLVRDFKHLAIDMEVNIHEEMVLKGPSCVLVC